MAANTDRMPDRNAGGLRGVSPLRAIAASCLALVLSFAFALQLHFLDVGQGDVVVIVVPDGRAIVYDAGPDRHTMLDSLQRLGVTEVPLIVASHAHADHINGFPAVIDAFAPAFALDNGMPHTTLAYERYVGALERSGTHLLEPTARTITVGDVALHVLPAPGQPSWGHNDNSVGLIIEYGDFRASLTGDAERRLFEWWLATVPDRLAPVQVHKASHHGSVNGDTRAALARLRPELVVVSAGADKPYGHPHAGALARYAEVGATVMRTDEHGNVTIRASSDGSYDVTTERSSTTRAFRSLPPQAKTPRWTTARHDQPPRTAHGAR